MKITENLVFLQALLDEHKLLNHNRTYLWEAKDSSASKLADEYQQRLVVIHKKLVDAGVLHPTHGLLTYEAQLAGLVD